MASLIRFRTGMLALALGLGLTGAFACGPQLFPIAEPEYGEPVCMLAITKGYWNDGRSRLIINDDKNLAPAGCACLHSRYRDDWTEDEFDMLAELTLAECERMAEANFDFDWNDCQADFEADAWYWHVFYVGPDGDTHAYMPDDLYCVSPE